MAESTAVIEIPANFQKLFETTSRYVVIYGGRGGAKSWTVALYIILEMLNRKVRVLCTREIQRTIKDSVHQLLCDTIERLDLSKYFVVTRDNIKSINGSEIKYCGLWQNITEIKSMEGIDICWVEEAQKLSEQSLEILTPTIRKIGSRIIFTYNPYSEFDAVHKHFVKINRDNCVKIKVNIFDLPEEMQSKEFLKEAQWDKENNYALFKHKWLGEFYILSEGQIFAGKFKYSDMPEKFDWTCCGIDFGYAEDPTVWVKVGVAGKELFIIDEKIGRHIEIDQMFDWLGEINCLIVADSARPELISHLRKKYRIIPSVKGKNSVLEGIEKIKNFSSININKTCEYTYSEFQLYSWKIDKRTDKIIPEPIDKDNHAIDAIRYALEQYRVSSNILQVGVL